MLIRTLGGASGAHFNPAVTATLAALRKIAPVDAAIYIVLQAPARSSRALIVKLLLMGDEARPSTTARRPSPRRVRCGRTGSAASSPS